VRPTVWLVQQSRRSASLYVEAFIRADPERVRLLAQDPEAHARWDLRFSHIEAEEALDGGGYRFRYERRTPLHTIIGSGTSVEEHRADGARGFVLRFATRDRLSPIRDGGGYLRLVPADGGVRLLTGYDYRPGFGGLADRVVRPLLVWMTAWSFDRLRIWAETGVPPERWPARSVLWLHRPRRPRARRCLTVAPDTRRELPLSAAIRAR
jgi:hypothetical protein